MRKIKISEVVGIVSYLYFLTISKPAPYQNQTSEPWLKKHDILDIYLYKILSRNWNIFI